MTRTITSDEFLCSQKAEQLGTCAQAQGTGEESESRDITKNSETSQPSFQS